MAPSILAAVKDATEVVGYGLLWNSKSPDSDGHGPQIYSASQTGPQIYLASQTQLCVASEMQLHATACSHTNAAAQTKPCATIQMRVHVAPCLPFPPTHTAPQTQLCTAACLWMCAATQMQLCMHLPLD